MKTILKLLAALAVMTALSGSAQTPGLWGLSFTTQTNDAALGVTGYELYGYIPDPASGQINAFIFGSNGIGNTYFDIPQTMPNSVNLRVLKLFVQNGINYSVSSTNFLWDTNLFNPPTNNFEVVLPVDVGSFQIYPPTNLLFRGTAVIRITNTKRK